MSQHRLPRPHFLLKIYINDSKYPELRDIYESAVHAHNLKATSYLEGGNAGFDAGFDLFLPDAITVELKSAVHLRFLWIDQDAVSVSTSPGNVPHHN